MSGAVDPHFDLFIAGQSVPGSRSEPKVLLNPADNRPLTTVADGTAGDATHAMEAAYKAFRESGWAGDDGAKRGRTLWKLAKLLEEQAEGFALLETLNMGKTLKESRFDVGYVVRTLEYFAGLADKVHGETIPVPGPRFDYTLREPLGVTVHIAPWNYPLLLSIRSVAPALAAGNAVVLKPASLTPLTALKFARLAKDAGVPDGILNVVTGPGAEVGEALVRDPRCASVTFTGSGDVGRRIAELAAARFIPTTLELGGKSPVVVLPDADLDRAAKGIATGIFSNAGQMCWAGSRLVVHETIKDELVRKVSDIAAGYRLGPGTEPTSDVGPLVSREQEARVTEFIQEAGPPAAGSPSGAAVPRTRRSRRGTSCDPRWSLTWSRANASSATRCSGPCSPSSHSGPRRRPSGSRTRPATASSRCSGRRSSPRPTCSPGSWRRGS